MEWNLSDGIKTHRVALQGKDRDFTIQIGRKKFAARVLLHAPPRLTLLINQRHVVEADAVWRNGSCALTLDNIPYTISVRKEVSRTTQERTTTPYAAQNIVAPLPGRIVEVLVKPGDTTQPGQPVCIIEAMKMQNEIFATRAATIDQVLVQPGDAVEGGSLLMKFKD